LSITGTRTFSRAIYVQVPVDRVTSIPMYIQ
jgi:hypothetical protein